MAIVGKPAFASVTQVQPLEDQKDTGQPGLKSVDPSSETTRSLADDPKIKAMKIKANKVYQAQLKGSLIQFRQQQEKVHRLFEKSFKKKLKAVEKENKAFLVQTMSNYASIVEDQDKHIQAVIAKNHKIAHKPKNDFVIRHIANDPPSPPRKQTPEEKGIGEDRRSK